MLEEARDKKIDETLELARENNKILHRMQRAARWGRLFWLLKWGILIAVALLGYYFLQPYIDTLMKAYETVQQQIGTIKDTAGKASGFFGN